MELKHILEAALLAAGRPLSLDQLQKLFPEEGARPDKARLREALAELEADYRDRAIELREVGSGWRIQVRSRFSPWVNRLWEEKPPRYSRALLETLAIIAYRQPITRGEIEEIRGVSVSTQILRTLQEREWVRIVGHRDVPGRPALYATTRQFLDYFNLKSLDDLPPLQALRDLEPETPGEAEAPPAAEVIRLHRLDNDPQAIDLLPMPDDSEFIAVAAWDPDDGEGLAEVPEPNVPEDEAPRAEDEAAPGSAT
ncbi:MAG: SMC-Scp complex subunit ScpB [Gammaproteobacteria bacterium]|nr:MAG: SMC-Scp complex subunit ScpB [Gammaproteobacteria bacterium]